MSLKALSDYTIYAKYARYIPAKQRRETWEEQVERVFVMHERKFHQLIETDEEFKSDFFFTKRQVLKKRVLGSQRSLQFGGAQIEKHPLKLYNCSSSFVDRIEVFNEIFYVLLCGCGVGFSIQKHHVAQLPEFSNKPKTVTEKWTIDDSIEGWADSIAVLMSSFFGGGKFPHMEGIDIEFDYSQIRPAGALISGGFKAPGPEGLEKALNIIRNLLIDYRMAGQTRLTPVNAYDIIMHISDAVLSGGVRRSACLTLFSPGDEEMLNAKTGDWFIRNPQRGRSNNSALLLRDNTSKEDFGKLFKSVKEFGEPGFVFSDSTEYINNPCVEITMHPVNNKGVSGFGLCNLTEINGKWCTTEENFYQACRASAILGTMQAAYTDFKYLSPATKEIAERDALLGCSITGMMDNPDILFDQTIQKQGAKLILHINEKIAEKIGINPCARATCVKPAGTTSCVLGTASGIHPHHSRRYIRRVQANTLEFPVKYYEKMNPVAVEDSVWSNNKTDKVINFLCEVPPGGIVKNQLCATKLLEKVKMTQESWVKCGTRNIDSDITHNVSNTITVFPEEWDEVEKYIYDNRHSFAGISLLPASGDKDYPQAPFTNILTPKEIEREYGDASVFASGLIVDGLKAFNDNLWDACNCMLGIGESLLDEMKEPDEPKRPKKNGYTDKEYNRKLIKYTKELEKFYMYLEKYDEWYYKKEWLRRAQQFANRYFEGNIRRMTYCLKDVNNWKKWCDIKREHNTIDWSQVVEEEIYFESVNTMGAQACAGGKCDISF